jgi:hypothetical protein
VALRGVVIILRTAPALSTANRGAWVPGPGVFVCLLGQLLVAGGLATHWWHALRDVDGPSGLLKALVG